MDFSKRLVEARKQKGWSQSELADMVDSTSITIGRYERNEIKPSIEVAAKLAVALGISLDFLAAITDNNLDSAVLQKILDIQKLSETDRLQILATLDALLRDAKARKAYA
jgi:transcriptional regulator with XRE-family HTH domain